MLADFMKNLVLVTNEERRMCRGLKAKVHEEKGLH